MIYDDNDTLYDHIDRIPHLDSLFILTKGFNYSFYTEFKGFNYSIYTEYRGSSALLSENIFPSKWSVYPIFIKFYDDWKYADDRKYYDDSFSQSLNHGFLNKTFVWILGANFNDTSKIDARKGLKCSEYSCYEKSLENGKICTPGRLTNM